MAHVKINPEASKFPYLPTAGIYPGQDHEDCECELIAYEYPATSADQGGLGAGPGYDRDGSRDGPYAAFRFRVKSDEFGIVTVTQWESNKSNTGSRHQEFLTALGVQLDAEGGFDPDTVAPRKCSIEVGDPREDKEGRWYTGRIRTIYGM